MNTFDLPSGGKLYPENSALSAGQIDLRPMIGADEEILASGKKDSVDKLLERCITTKDVKISDLYPEDKMFLFIMLRAISYGDNYTFSIKCDDCGERNEYTIDLTKDLHVNALEEEGPFELVLESSEKIITWDYVDGKTEQMIQARIRRQKHVKKLDEGELTYLRAAAIKTIDGNDATPKEAIEFIKNLNVKDVWALQYDIDNRKFGIVTKLMLECEHCGYETEVDMPVNVEFFRTDRKRNKPGKQG